MKNNLSEKHGGLVSNISTHCRWLHERPLLLERSTLCTGGRYWTPCPDLHICKNLPPPVWHIQDLIVDVFTRIPEDELCCLYSLTPQ
jgi:hypothetical protein